jgi:hypothetical protein
MSYPIFDNVSLGSVSGNIKLYVDYSGVNNLTGIGYNNNSMTFGVNQSTFATPEMIINQIGDVSIIGNVSTGGNLVVNSTTASTSTSSGALRVAGGVGIQGNLNIGGLTNHLYDTSFNGNTQILLQTASTSTSSGALTVAGGVGIQGNLNIGGLTNHLYDTSFNGNAQILSQTASTSITTGALTVAGGVGIVGNLNVGGFSNFAFDSSFNGNIQLTQSNNPLWFVSKNTSSFNGTLATNANDVGIFYGTTNPAAAGLVISPRGTGGGIKMDIAGNVGIGTNPIYKLDVNGMIRSTDLRIDTTRIHLGTNAGLTSQSAGSVAIGDGAGQTSQAVSGDNAVAIGRFAGQTSQGDSCVAIGAAAGKTSQAAGGLAIGTEAGETRQKAGAMAIGFQAGRTDQFANAIAIGNGAGNSNQGTNSVAIGYNSAGTGTNSVAIGNAANTSTFGNSVAIGAGASCDAANQITLGTASETVRILGTLNFSARPQTWYLSSTSNANATTAAGKNIGGLTFNTPTSAYFNAVTVFGGANASNWNTGTAVFTASQSGLYQFQLSIFINTPSTTGRWLSAGGTCIPFGIILAGGAGNSQYLSWGQSYISIEGSLSVSCSFYMSAGETFFWYAQNVTPSIFYGHGHTYCQIIKVY